MGVFRLWGVVGFFRLAGLGRSLGSGGPKGVAGIVWWPRVAWD